MVTRGGAEPDGDEGADGREVLADGLARSLRDRLAASAFRRLPVAWHRPRLVRAATLLTVTTLAAGAAMHALRPPDAAEAAAPRLVGVSISVPPPGADAAGSGAVEATYRFAPLAPGSRLRLAGLRGPLVRASTSRRVVAAEGGGPVFRVSATPACHALNATAPHRYSVALTRTASDGTLTRRRLRTARVSVNWWMALHQVCWQALATRGISIAGLRAEPEGRSRGLVLTVSLRSRLADDVAVQVIDVADVSTLAAADGGELRAGGRRALRVRWPVTDCAAPTLPEHTYPPTSRSAGEVRPALEWTVGPSRRNPAAVFVTPLSPSQLTIVRAAVDRLCTPARGAAITRHDDDQHA